MQSNLLTTWIMPAGLVSVMFGLGLGLRTQDFARVLRAPRGLVVGFVGQVLVLPALGWCVAWLAALAPQEAVGLLLLAACGGGAVSGALTRLAGGDAALSIALTSISLPISALTIPLYVGWADAWFLDGPRALDLPIAGTVLQLMATIWLPVVLGMYAGFRRPLWAAVLEPWTGRLSATLIGAVTLGIMWTERDGLGAALVSIGGAAFVLNATSLSAGYGMAAFAGLGFRQRLTIAIEVGIQNSATALFVALTLLQRPALAVPAAVYTVVAYVNVALIIFYFRLTRARAGHGLAPGDRAHGADPSQDADGSVRSNGAPSCT